MDNCIFCKIANGDIPSATVYEDDSFRAILDIAPAHKGHVIVLPKAHADNLFELDDEIAAKALPIVKKIATALKAVSGCDGINVLQNNGTAAGQSVFHLHIHIVPRFEATVFSRSGRTSPMPTVRLQSGLLRLLPRWSRFYLAAISQYFFAN